MSVSGFRNVIAVASGKGGVGKSTVAVNLAVALARTGAKVGLLDADVWGPCVPAMTGLQGVNPRAAGEGRIQPLSSCGLKLMSMGFLVAPEESLAFRGPVVHQVIREFVDDVDWGDLDYLFIDLPPGTGDAVLTVIHSLPLTGAVLVSTPQDVAAAAVVRCVALFREREVPLVGLVENMSASVCPHCGESLGIFGSGRKVRDMAAYWEIPFLGAVPLDPSVREGGDSGEPVVLRAPISGASKAFREMARRLAAEVKALPQGSPRRRPSPAPAPDVDTMTGHQ